MCSHMDIWTLNRYFTFAFHIQGEIVIAVEPTVPPTEPPTKPPTAPPTKPPTEPPTEAPTEHPCEKQLGRFKENGLPVDPVFVDTVECRFELKQCNSKRCWCVKAKSGDLAFQTVEGFDGVPLGEVYDCSCKLQQFT